GKLLAGCGFILLGILVLFPLWFPLLASLGERPSDGVQSLQNEIKRHAKIWDSDLLRLMALLS
ncbi:MAG: hypothetical protein KDB05_32505, partial [Planctomycetales bacterium]|nr:hypothetical protein [Planctomycetales bacterium]